MSKYGVSIVLGLVLLASAVDARAQGCRDGMGGGMQGGGMMGGMGHRGMDSGMGGGMMMDDDHPLWNHIMGLGIDAKQKDAILQIKSKVLKDSIRKGAEKRIAGIELDDLLAKDPVDMKAVEAALKKIETLRTELHFSHIKAKEEMKSKLSPEQRKRLQEILEASREMSGMMGGMGCRMMHGEDAGHEETGPAEKKGSAHQM